LLSPNTQVFILDLPGTLFFSYLFIAGNFPEAKILFVTEKDFTLQTMPREKSSDSALGTEGYDFVFIPISLIHTLFNESFDVVINTQSLGEMSDKAVNRYMQFIQHDIHAKYFYSLNRYGRFRHTPRHIDSGSVGLWGAGYETACKTSVKLDPYWKTHLWDLYGKNSFSAIDGSTPPSLEILVERMPRSCLSDDYRLLISNSLFQEAVQLPVQDEHWQHLMWESIRLYPNPNNLNFYLEFLARQHYFEFHHYKELYDKLTPK